MQAHPHAPFAVPAAILLALALLCPPTALLGAGRMDTPSEEELIARGFRFVTEKPADKFHEIPGDDTIIRVYKKGQETVGLYMLRNGLVYGYAVKSGGQPMAAYIDEYNSGYCEKDVSAGENFMIDLRAYGMDRASRRK